MNIPEEFTVNVRNCKKPMQNPYTYNIMMIILLQLLCHRTIGDFGNMVLLYNVKPINWANL